MEKNPKSIPYSTRENKSNSLLGDFAFSTFL